MRTALILAGIISSIFSLNVVKAEPLPHVDEYFIFHVPELPLTEPTFISWFFLRSDIFWNASDKIDLAQLKWPAWDKQQIPLSLVPGPQQKTKLLIYDQNKKLIEEIDFKQPFSPEEYLSKSPVRPGFFQVRLMLNQDRVTVTSPLYGWYQKKQIANCNVSIDSDSDWSKNKSFKVCVETLKAYFSDSSQQNREMYMELQWPKIQGRENRSFIQALERELKSGARRKKIIFLAKPSKESQFQAAIGLTQTEDLPVIQFPLGQLPDTEVAEFSPDNKTVQKVIFDWQGADGSQLQVKSLYSDALTKRSLESPKLKGRTVHLQVINQDGTAADRPGKIQISETRNLEKRTGMPGFLRPWQILGFGSINHLSSSRGETTSFLGLPGIDLKYNYQEYQLEPYLRFEKSLIHAGTSLELTEFKAGLNRKTNLAKGAFYSLGYQKFNLAGKNPGATRLGDLTAITAGVGASQRFEDWYLREKLDLLFGNSQSVDVHFDFGKVFTTESDEKFYIGSFLGYSSYRAYVTNKINIRELLSENRMQVGLSIGWIGADSF